VADKTDENQITTNSGIPVKAVYGPDDVDINYESDLGRPGTEPYTRGPYPTMYRDRPWRIFQLSGYGLPEHEGERIKLLLEQGEMGFIMEPDLMTVYGMLDMDDPDVIARKDEVGQFGATLHSLEEYERALEGIPIESTYAHPGGVTPLCSPFCHACYFSVAQKRGIPLEEMRGTGEGDMFLTYLATPIRKPIPPEHAIRLNCDFIEFCRENVPRWIPVSVPGTNARETGLNGVQHLAVTFANAVAYIEELLRRGRLKIDDFAYGIGGIGLCPHTDFFEDIAILRAARRMWYKLIKEQYGAKDSRSTRLRIHVNVGGSTSTYQQPLNNIVRGTIGMLAAALGGIQSAGVTAFDEALCIPSEQAHIMSLRTQQIIQLESGVTSTVDPLAGSYYVEWLTNEAERETWKYLEEIELRGGLLGVLNSGWLYQEAHAGAMEKERKILSGERKVVGVNCFKMEEELFEATVFRSPQIYDEAKARVDNLKKKRDPGEAERAMDQYRRACQGTENVMPPLMKAVQAGVTAGEVGEIQREVFGVWNPPIPI